MVAPRAVISARTAGARLRRGDVVLRDNLRASDAEQCSGRRRVMWLAGTRGGWPHGDDLRHV
jgi:hypothetical protein